MTTARTYWAAGNRLLMWSGLIGGPLVFALLLLRAVFELLGVVGARRLRYRRSRIQRLSVQLRELGEKNVVFSGASS